MRGKLANSTLKLSIMLVTAQRLVTRHTTGNPLLSLFVAGAIGYALAWMIHGERRNRDRHVPDYARTRHGYASQGDA